MGETRSGKMTSEIRWSHGSLTNKKEVSEDTRYQGVVLYMVERKAH